MRIVLLAEAGGGKDLLAEYLIKKYGFSRYAFADYVRNVAQTWFPEQYGDGKTKNRSLLQDIGTKFREIDEDVWINALLKDIESERRMRINHSYRPEDIVVTDCRMPNEYRALQEKNFVFIRVITNENIRRQRLIDRGDIFTEKDLKHHTESFYDYFHYEYEISNNDSKEEAFESLDKIIQRIIGG